MISVAIVRATPIRLDREACATRLIPTPLERSLAAAQPGYRGTRDARREVAIPGRSGHPQPAPHTAKPSDNHRFKTEYQACRPDRRIKIRTDREKYACYRNNRQRQGHRHGEHVASVEAH